MSPRLRIEYLAIFYYIIFSFIHGGIEKRGLSKRDDFCQNVKCPWSLSGAVCGSDGVTYKVSYILKSLTLRRMSPIKPMDKSEESADVKMLIFRIDVPF